MKKFNLLIAALILTVFMACQKDNSTAIPLIRSVNLADTLSIKMNETVFSGDFSIKLDSIQESRCPTDVTCVTAGFVAVKLIVKKDNNSQIIRLINIPKSDTITVFNHHIRLLSVLPYPNSVANQIPQNDYIIKLLVR